MDAALHFALADLARLWNDELEQLIETLEGPTLCDALLKASLDEQRQAIHTAEWTERSKVYEQLWYGDEEPSVSSVIRTLDGIEGFSSIDKVVLEMSCVSDLSPLTKLPLLETVRVGVEPETSLLPLLECRKLKRVDVLLEEGADSHRDHEVLLALKRRGVFVDPLEPKSPDASPFDCWKLKLAVLHALTSKAVPARLRVKLPKYAHFDPFRLDKNLLGHLTHLPITQQQLDAITELYWVGGGLDVQHCVWPQYNGEGDDFDIENLLEVEVVLKNLKSVRISPLAQIPSGDIEQLRARGIRVSEA